MRIISVAAILVFSSVVAMSAGKDEGQIVVINMSRVIQNYQGTVSSEAILKKQFQEFEAEKDSLVGKLEQMQKDLEAAYKETENSALSEEVRKEKKKAVEADFVDMKKYQQSVKETLQLRQEQMADEKGRLQKRIFENLKAVVDKHARSMGYGMVIDTTSLIYSQEKFDITDDIIKILQKEEKDLQK